MKLTKYLAGFSALAFASAAYADVDVTITGATAFRAAALASIKAKYDVGNGGISYKYAHDQASTKLTGATRAIFIGKFPGVSGTTTIRCCFTGSVEGVRALVPITDPSPPTYYQSSLLDSYTAGTSAGGTEYALNLTSGQIAVGTNNGAAALGTQSDIAFSDVSKSSTPYAAYSLLPASPSAGVIVFTMITNKGSVITNVSSQQFRALLTSGYQPLSMFTGNAGDTNPVFATGRNDGSGTRTTYLAEVGYGIVKTVKQYVANTSSGGALTQIQLVPAGGVNSPALTGQSTSNASTVWGQDVAGNGGYNSGATLRGDMAQTSGAVTVLDETGADAFGGAISCSLVTWLSVSDAATARTGGATFCSYNGEKLVDIAAGGTAMSTGDIAKIANGKYTAWGYERMYRRNDITSGDKLTVDAAVRGAIPANIGAAGVPLTSMNVSRPGDGALVAP